MALSDISKFVAENADSTGAFCVQLPPFRENDWTATVPPPPFSTTSAVATDRFVAVADRLPTVTSAPVKKEIFPGAVSTRLPLGLVTGWFTSILLLEFSVRVEASSQSIGASTVMLPAPPRPSPGVPVLTTTSPISRLTSRSLTLMTEVPAVKVPSGPKLPSLSSYPGVVGSMSWIVTSTGSRSNVPDRPCGARVSTRPLKASTCLPDTSTKPPSPPVSPPRAPMLPLNCV